MSALWTATRSPRPATADGRMAAFEATGVAFDSREVEPGDLFVALKGEATDGHRFVGKAFASGAAGVARRASRRRAACPSSPTPWRRSTHLGRARRAQRTPARIIGVTGSVGKTSTKEALCAALDRAAPGCAHRSVKSYNNHTGVPLSLARMPRDAALRRVRDGHEPCRRARGADPAGAAACRARHHCRARRTSRTSRGEEAIADAKGEIFQGLEPGGTAIDPVRQPAIASG